jgi:hypothetical protein
MKIKTKKIKIEDFEKEIQPTISKLAWSLNPLYDQLESLINRKGLTVQDNLPFQYQTFVVDLNASGEPKQKVIISNPFGNIFKGFTVCNVTGSATITGAPFIVWELNGLNILVKQITGLPQDVRFTVTALLLS